MLPGGINNEPGGYTFERLSAESLYQLGVLYTAVYGFKRASGFYNKKYSTAYTGQQYIGYIAYDKRGAPVAYLGVVPCFLQCVPEVILAAQSVDTMVHPAHRGNGLLAEVYRLTLALCKAEGFKALFGFPNQDYYPILKGKFGWEEVGVLHRFEVPVPMAGLAGICSGIPLVRKALKPYRKYVLQKLAVSLNGVAFEGAADGFACVYRSDAYLSYKKYSGTTVVAVGGAQAWLKVGDGLVVGDIRLNGNSFESVLQGLKILAAKLGLRKIHFHCSEGAELHKLFARHYPPLPSFNVLFKGLGAGCNLGNARFTFADIDIF